MLTILIVETETTHGAGTADPAALGELPLVEEHTFDAPDELRRTPLEHWLAREFTLPDAVNPAAYTLRAAAQGAQLAESAISARPVHLQATMDHLVLHPPDILDIHADEARDLARTASEHFAADGIEVNSLTPGCWSLTAVRGLHSLDLASVQAAHGRNVDLYMPAGSDGRQARALLNEVQMLWHEHPVNQAREAAGRPPLNSLWLEGPCPAPIQSPYVTVLTDIPMVQGLALAGAVHAERAGLPSGSVSEHLQSRLEPGPLLWAPGVNEWPLLEDATKRSWPAGSQLIRVTDTGWRAYDLSRGATLRSRLRRWFVRRPKSS